MPWRLLWSVVRSLPRQEIENEALALSSSEGARLAHDRIASLDAEGDQADPSAWDRVMEKRVEEIRQGTAEGQPAEEVLAAIRARYS